MKMLKLEKIILIAISSVAVLSSAIVPIVSYASYKRYYDNAIANKPTTSNEKTYDEPILKSISIRLQDGKAFYKNGKANPVKTDFIVEGTYAISDNDTYVDQINASDYTMDIPSDFAINGGTISVTYKEFTSSIDISLIDVRLSELYPLAMPYKVYYKVGEVFDKDGLKLEAKYNDGTIVNVDNFVVENKSLTKETTSIKISFSKDKETIDYLLPISVVDEKDYNNGKIISIESNSFALAGVKLSTNKFLLRATFESGNRLLLSSDDYTLINGEDIANLGDETILKLEVNGQSINVNINVSAQVEAINGQLENAITHGDYVSFDTNASAIFKFNATHNFVGNINLKLRTAVKDIKLNNLINLTINKSLNSINKDIVITKENEFDILTVKGVKIFKGNNNIAISCLKESFDLASIDVVSTQEELTATTLGEFVMSNDVVEFNKECVFGEGTPAAIDGFTHVQGGCSDDNYIYYLFADELNHEAKLTKYSIEENTFVSKSNKFNIGPNITDWTWDSGNITLIGEKIIVTDYQGKFLAFDKETLTEVACPEFKFPDISKQFDSWDSNNASITALEYNEALDMYAITARPSCWNSNAYLFLFDGEFNQIGEMINLETHTEAKWGGYKMRSLQSNGNYLYALFGEENYKNAVVQIYSWNGTLLKEQVFSDLAPYGGTRSSPRNIVEYKGSLYLTIYNDSGLNGAILYKMSYVETNIDLPSKTYLISGSSIVLENGLPTLQIKGSLSDLTKDDFNFTLLAMKSEWEYTLEEFDMEINGDTFVVKYDLSKLSSECEYIFYFNKKSEQTYDADGNLRDGLSFIVPTDKVSYNGLDYIGKDIWGHAGLRIQEAQTYANTISYNSYKIENIDGKAILTINANIDIEDMSKLRLVITRFTTWGESEVDYDIKKLEDGTMEISTDISNLESDGKTSDGLNGGYFIELNTNTIKDNKVQLGDGLSSITIGGRTYSFEEFYGNLKIVITTAE